MHGYSSSLFSDCLLRHPLLDVESIMLAMKCYFLVCVCSGLVPIKPRHMPACLLPLTDAREAILRAIVGGETFALGAVGLAVTNGAGPEASTLTLLAIVQLVNVVIGLGELAYNSWAEPKEARAKRARSWNFMLAVFWFWTLCFGC